MRILVFDLKGQMAHFRRPDTTGTQATYPFITRTALRGLVASILGLDEFEGEAYTGIELMSPVRTRTQQFLLLGKGWFGESRSTFNRRTSIEMVISPEYRIYYSGDYLEQLADMIEARQAYYHTYLGAAFCPTFPRFVDAVESQIVEPSVGGKLQCRTVAPAHAIHELILVEGHQYARAGGILYEHIGGRRFRGTVNVIYEINGRELYFIPETNNSGVPYYFCKMGGKVVCLW